LEKTEKKNCKKKNQSTPKMPTNSEQSVSPSKLKICFLHPDLGLGGAERLIVDAAAGLSLRGHSVSVFTNHYESGRSFAETRDGSFRVRTSGEWIPRSLFGGLHILCSNVQNAWLALSVAASCHLFGDTFDVAVCDQVSLSVPLLRLLLPSTAVVFYCHFPDQLLSKRTSIIKNLYRAPFDLLEEVTTGLADIIVVNSEFTSRTFLSTFSRLGFHSPKVLYPCVSIHPVTAAARSVKPIEEKTDKVVFLSINRFERKKSIDLAIRAMGLLRNILPEADFDRVHLIIAGGYDLRVTENVEHHKELIGVARDMGLVNPLSKKGGVRRHSSSGSLSSTTPTELDFKSDLLCIQSIIPGWSPLVDHPKYDQAQVGSKVTFIRSFTDVQKSDLLRVCSAVIYTPQNEHFGIVPLECAAARRPVIACNSGGPLESVLQGKTGFLCEPTPEAFATAMASLVTKTDLAVKMGTEGRLHVEKSFSRDNFSAVLEGILLNIKKTLWATRRFRCLERLHLFIILFALLAVFPMSLMLLKSSI